MRAGLLIRVIRVTAASRGMPTGRMPAGHSLAPRAEFPIASKGIRSRSNFAARSRIWGRPCSARLVGPGRRHGLLEAVIGRRGGDHVFCRDLASRAGRESVALP